MIPEAISNHLTRGLIVKNGETLSVTSTTVPVVLTPAKYAGMKDGDTATLTVEGGPMRFYAHPTASADVSTANGHLLLDGDEVDLENDEIAHFAVVKTGSTNGKVVASYKAGE